LTSYVTGCMSSLLLLGGNGSATRAWIKQEQQGWLLYTKMLLLE
jgi:hypothetical protein